MARNTRIKAEPIVQFGSRFLREKCRDIDIFHRGVHQKIDLLAYTLKRHGGGAALAAPQISLLKRIIVINYLDQYFELINPEILDASGEVIDVEGCLSLPGYAGRVKRYKQVKVRYQDRTGAFHTVEAEDRMARCFQHEMDHLDGILYIDRMTDETVVHDETEQELSVIDLIRMTNKNTRA